MVSGGSREHRGLSRRLNAGKRTSLHLSYLVVAHRVTAQSDPVFGAGPVQAPGCCTPLCPGCPQLCWYPGRRHRICIQRTVSFSPPPPSRVSSTSSCCSSVGSMVKRRPSHFLCPCPRTAVLVSSRCRHASFQLHFFPLPLCPATFCANCLYFLNARHILVISVFNDSNSMDPACIYIYSILLIEVMFLNQR